MTYHPILRWRCLRCGAHDEIVYDLCGDLLIRWERVVDAHAAASPGCHGEIAVEEAAGSVPQSS